MEWMLPLETLPGWPEAPAFSLAHLILIALILPATTGVILAVLAWTPTWARRGRATAAEVEVRHTAAHAADET